MLTWLCDHLATIIICIVLVLIVTAIIVSLIKNKKKGKSSCGCNCAHCAMADSCHKKWGHGGDAWVRLPRFF